MQEEIINRVAKSKLLTIDLEDYCPKGPRILLDIKDWLFEGLILREKEFRQQLNAHRWEDYTGAHVAITCSTDAIVPGWAFMLLAIKLQPFAKSTVQGCLEDLETRLYDHIIDQMDITAYKDRPVIIKGCSTKPVPANAYIRLTQKLQPVAASIMYGEACSSVPLYKRK